MAAADGERGRRFDEIGSTAGASFTGDAYVTQPALVLNSWGKGRTIHIGGVKLDDATADVCLEYALSQAGVSSCPETPEHVEVIRRGGTIFAINYTDADVAVQLDVQGDAITGSYERGSARLEPYGVCVIESKP